MYVYRRSEPGLYTVGFYRPDQKWEAESDHTSTEAAAARVAYLNGQGRPMTNAEARSAIEIMQQMNQKNPNRKE